MGTTYGKVSFIFGSLCIPLCVAFSVFSALVQQMSLMGTSLPELVLLLNFLAYLFPGIAILFGIIGIILDDDKGKAITGFILGVIAIILAIVLTLLLSSMFDLFTP